MDVLSDKHCLVCAEAGFSMLLPETRFKKLDHVPDQFIVRCNNCKIVTRSPSIFSPEFNTNADLDLRQHKDFIGGETESVSQYLMDRLLIAGKLVKEKTVLDIGSGSGAFLVFAKAQGWEVYGTEKAESSIEKLKSLGIRCFTGDLDDPEFQKNKFDLVHLNHVFEHVKDPLETLRNIEKLLKEDGMAIIEVPNEFQSLTQWARRILKLDGSSDTTYFQHEWFFSPQSMRDICERVGLKIVELKTPFRGSNSPVKDIVRFIAATLGRGDVIEVHLSRK